MAKQFKVEFCGDYVRTELMPDYSVGRENRVAMWKEIVEVCTANETQRVLIEGPVPKGERTTDEVVEAGKGTAAAPELWLAFHLWEFEPDETSELYEAIAKAGGVRVRFFTDKAKALSWLRLNAPN
ncbi:MAG: hypothetical protein DWQ47_15900 [Acidobacteria bacterium]|nr:MAG: hypothetical protein DWQ32_03300 [Acidobacteriota bacterium]REK02459.1 MAG: hypothetical protein DWQ38_08835 [Acidobacteriota bacterium]REK13739.1 MAG: hypothetical protein DWQ43_08990 [Acidobacteriota bacterium]REK41733.1 MAG: hypothetical protein DWQ47_15900 [Acidobacteriota bacterium]